MRMVVRRKRRLLVGLAAVVIVLGCLGAAGYAYLSQVAGALAIFGGADGTNACDPKTPQNTEEIGQFKFPPSMKILSSSCFGMQGWLGSAQFEMLPVDLDYLVSHSRIKDPLTSTGTPANEMLATKASSLKSYLHGSYHEITERRGLFRQFRQDILIDTSNPALYRVYINFSGG